MRQVPAQAFPARAFQAQTPRPHPKDYRPAVRNCHLPKAIQFPQIRRTTIQQPAQAQVPVLAQAQVPVLA